MVIGLEVVELVILNIRQLNNLLQNLVVMSPTQFIQIQPTRLKRVRLILY